MNRHITFASIRGMYAIGAAVCALVLATAGVAYAQFPQTAAQPLVITQTPQHPAPGQDVRFRVESFSFDLSRASITWSVDGTTVARGTGVQDVTLLAGDVGTEQLITVSAIINGTSLQSEVVVRPTIVDLIWESPRSHVPPLYRGKALPSHNGSIRVTALPTFVLPAGRRLDSNDLVFTWERNGRVLGSLSGTGKHTLQINQLDPFRDTIIRVKVASTDGGLVGFQAISVEPIALSLMFYEEHPLLGLLFNRTLQNTAAIDRDEVVVRAHPYFADATDLQFDWSVDGSRVTNPSNDSSKLTLRRTNTSVEETRIGLSVTSAAQPLQRASGGVILRFGGDGNNSFTNQNDDTF